MTIRSILVATDLSVQENLALQRAWQIARAHGATVTLMYVPPAGEQVPGTASARLAGAARQLEENLGLRVKTVPVGKEHKPEDLATEARGMDLVVLPHRRERSTAAFFRGEPVLRLLRSAACPVLVVRRDGGEPYRRILVAVDSSARSEPLLKFAADLDAQAELEVFHAISTRDEAKLRSAEAPLHAVRRYRELTLRRARERMLALSDAFTARRKRVVPAIGRGDAGQQTVLQQERSGADLVVLGKRRSSAWGDFFRGSVAHRVLSWASSDVLVVPDAHAQASAPVAARRAQGAMAPALALRQGGRG